MSRGAPPDAYDQWKHFVYDERNRQTQSYWNDSEAGTDRDVSIGDWTITMFDDASRVTNIATDSASGWTNVAYGYDEANYKIWEEQKVNNGPIRRVETLPDDDGNRHTLTVAGIYSLSYEYTQRQQLKYIKTNGATFFEYKYDKNSNLTRRQNLVQGGSSTVFTYDNLNRVNLCVQIGSLNMPFSVSDYNDYDLLNNLKSISRPETFPDIGSKGERFTYDDVNQLSSVSYRVDLPPRPAPQTDPLIAQLAEVAEVEKDWDREAFAALQPDPVREPLAARVPFDPDASSGPRTVVYSNNPINRVGMTDSNDFGTTVTAYTPNFLNQYTGVSGHDTPDYDENFNLSGYDGWTYLYDADKRLISATGTTNGVPHNAHFLYDGLGRCVKRTIDGVATVLTYDDWKPIVERDSSGGFVAWNLYGPGADEILVRYQPSISGYTYYHLDAMGNVQFLLSEDNLALETYTYDVFGHPTIKGANGDSRPVSQHGNRFLFTGREYLYTLGLYDYRHRVYHPGLGRFMQVDPIGFKGDPMNLYRYCVGNPILHSDPTGLRDWTWTRQMLWQGGKDGSVGELVANLAQQLQQATFTYVTGIDTGTMKFNGRTFNGGVKTSQTVTIDPCDCEITDAKKVIGTTNEYNASGRKIGSDRASGDSIQQSAQKEGKDCILKMKGNESNPLVADKAGITYNATITLHPSSRTYDWRVKHDAYPSHQLLGPNGTPVHHFGHVTSGTSPLRLLPFTLSINSSGNNVDY